MLHPSSIFPSTGLQVLSSLIHFVGVSVLAHCISRRVAVEHLTSVQGVLQMSWARLSILLIFVDSWLFVFSSGVVIFGAGMEDSIVTCSLGIFLCIVFYGSSKILIYCFLIEKVYIVWSPVRGSRRMKSPVYLLCLVTMLLYLVIVVLLLVGRIAYFRQDGACVIGLKRYASIPLLVYDLYVNVFLTTMFLWPLLRSSILNPAVKRVATRTSIASIAALTTSAINILVLTLMRGHQLGWICLGSCGTDVIVNALVLFWVTGGNHSTASAQGSNSPSPSGKYAHARPRADGTAPLPQSPAHKYDFRQEPIMLQPSAAAASPNPLARLASHRTGAAPVDEQKGPTAALGLALLMGKQAPKATLSLVRESPTVSGGELVGASKEIFDPPNPPSAARRTGPIARLFGLWSDASEDEHRMQVTVTREFTTDVGELNEDRILDYADEGVLAEDGKRDALGDA